MKKLFGMILVAVVIAGGVLTLSRDVSAASEPLVYENPVVQTAESNNSPQLNEEDYYQNMANYCRSMMGGAYNGCIGYGYSN